VQSAAGDDEHAGSLRNGAERADLPAETCNAGVDDAADTVSGARFYFVRDEAGIVVEDRLAIRLGYREMLVKEGDAREARGRHVLENRANDGASRERLRGGMGASWRVGCGLGRLRWAGLAGQQFTRAEHAKAASDAE
jgi:hypothetical protein